MDRGSIRYTHNFNKTYGETKSISHFTQLIFFQFVQQSSTRYCYLFIVLFFSFRYWSFTFCGEPGSIIFFI